jgi:hypothetical protein
VYDYHQERQAALEEEARMIQNQIENSEDEMTLCENAISKLRGLFTV